MVEREADMVEVVGVVMERMAVAAKATVAAVKVVLGVGGQANSCLEVAVMALEVAATALEAAVKVVLGVGGTEVD